MIRFSTRGEYGLRMMMDLARHYGQGPQPLSEIARHEALPVSYLEQLVGKVRKAGLLASSHGAHGGYELTRPPAEITVGEVLRVLEGPISPMVCATEGESEMLCERQVFCSANLVWERVRDSVAQALDSLTLADLVPPKAPVPGWDPAHTITLTPIQEPKQAHRRSAATL
ncbi:MAG TPA: Rrf2 family transcriptional regulator [Chloroflexota bacterium]|nr:Rrf2 family transcriptional regulator [Chloroflexota bacterium]